MIAMRTSFFKSFPWSWGHFLFYSHGNILHPELIEDLLAPLIKGHPVPLSCQGREG